MNNIVTKAIVLTRTNFGEADRIITVLTPDHGKVTLMAKGVRRINSKLAGGIELFCLSEISYLVGRGDMGRLISSRLDIYFSNIVHDINRTMYGYEVIKTINRITEDLAGKEYFMLLKSCLAELNENRLSLSLLQIWFGLQLLKLTGHTPNLINDNDGNRLAIDLSYNFSVDDMGFSVGGQFGSAEIKLLRLALSLDSPAALSKVSDVDMVAESCNGLVKTMVVHYLRV